MAKQVGPLFITGTIDGIIFYKLGEQYYLRSKGSYKSAKRMRRDPRLKRTMEKASQFGAASKITKEVYYRHLPREVRKQGLFGKLTGIVNGWLQKGKTKEDARELLIAHCQTLVPAGLVAPITPVTYVAEPAPARAVPATISAEPPVVHTASKPISTTHSNQHRVKQAHYLSRWKVNPNGLLHISKRKMMVNAKLITGKQRKESRLLHCRKRST